VDQMGLIYCAKVSSSSDHFHEKLGKIYCRNNFSMKGGGMQDAYITFKLLKMI